MSTHVARRAMPAIAIILGLLLVAGLALAFWPQGEVRRATAEFPRAVAVYEGSLVKILGVTVGEVDSVKPAGDRVVVRFHYDAKYKVSQASQAVVISPSVVGDRFIQFTKPAVGSDPVLPDGAKLSFDKKLPNGLPETAVPLELDQVFGSLNDLAVALGPTGANKPDASGKGALTRLLDATARNFGGQGVQFNKTLRSLGKLTQTLANNKDELFGTVSQVEEFTSTLAKNDDTVRRFNDSLAQGADLLADERQELAAVLTNLGTAMRQVRGFVHDNRRLLTQNIHGIERISRILAKNRKSLDESLRAAPVAAENLYLSTDEHNRTLDTRMNAGENIRKLTTEPGTILCSILGERCDGAVEGLLGLLNDLASQSSARPAPFKASDIRVLDQSDRSLGGLVEVSR